MLKTNASVPVDSRVFVQNRSSCKYLADVGLTEVVKTDSQQYDQNHGKVLVEAIAAEIQPIEFGRKVEKTIRFDVVVHDPDDCSTLLYSSNATKLNLRPTMLNVRKRENGVTLGRLLRGRGTGGAADKQGSLEIAKAAGVKADQNSMYENHECLLCGKQGHKQWD